MKLRAKFDLASTKTPRTTKPARSAPADDDDLSPAARNLALAHLLARLIDQGVLADYTQAAQALGVSQPRITHLMGLLLLAPAIQEAMLFDQLAPREKDLRRLAQLDRWSDQSERVERDARRQRGDA